MLILRRRKLYLAVFSLVFAAVIHAEGDPMKNPNVQKTLRGMEKTSTWYHDDLFGEYAGFLWYARHRYADALHYFEIGAYYADKPSQLSIGLMHLNGEGVAKDPITAFAWIDLAAERGYPTFVSTRDRVKATLTLEQLAQAVQLRKKLDERYGDAAAKPRMAAELSQGLMQMTGSRAGFDAGVKFLPLDALKTNSPGPIEVETICASGFWAKECWKPELYFAMRDKQLNATVTVGAIEEKGK